MLHQRHAFFLCRWLAARFAILPGHHYTHTHVRTHHANPMRFLGPLSYRQTYAQPAGSRLLETECPDSITQGLEQNKEASVLSWSFPKQIRRWTERDRHEKKGPLGRV